MVSVAVPMARLLQAKTIVWHLAQRTSCCFSSMGSDCSCGGRCVVAKCTPTMTTPHQAVLCIYTSGVHACCSLWRCACCCCSQNIAVWQRQRCCWSHTAIKYVKQSSS